MVKEVSDDLRTKIFIAWVVFLSAGADRAFEMRLRNVFREMEVLE